MIPTPADLYPTDVYTLEYDGFADFSQYPIDPLSDLNAFAGMIYEHLTYLALDPARVQEAIPLATTGDTLTDYFMIPVSDLPLLDPLRLIPFVGNPLADPLQPDVTVLVNLGSAASQTGTLLSPSADLVNDLASTLSADDGTPLPIEDTVNSLTTSLPAFDASLFFDQLEAGNLLGAIGDPIAAHVALIPFALFLGGGPVTDAIEGTLLNTAVLIP